MGWLAGYVMASIAASIVVVRVFDYFVGEATGIAKEATRTGVFVSVWTAITTAAGMRDFTTKVRSLRRLGNGMGKKLEGLITMGRRR